MARARRSSQARRTPGGRHGRCRVGDRRRCRTIPLPTIRIGGIVVPDYESRRGADEFDGKRRGRSLRRAVQSHGFDARGYTMESRRVLDVREGVVFVARRDVPSQASSRFRIGRDVRSGYGDGWVGVVVGEVRWRFLRQRSESDCEQRVRRGAEGGVHGVLQAENSRFEP